MRSGMDWHQSTPWFGRLSDSARGGGGTGLLGVKPSKDQRAWEPGDCKPGAELGGLEVGSRTAGGGTGPDGLGPQVEEGSETHTTLIVVCARL